MKLHLKCLILGLGLFVAGCEAEHPAADNVEVHVIGVDHLPEHEAVLGFSVNGVGSFQAAGAGSIACCLTLPRKWQPGLAVNVKWNVVNFRECEGDNYEITVPIGFYPKAGDLRVHFLPRNSIRIALDNVPLSGLTPDDHAIPAPVLEKEPWNVYSLQDICATKIIALAKAREHAVN